MNKLEEIKNILKNKKWSWWGQRAHDALGLNHLIDFEFVVCCDWGEDIRQLWGDKVISLELLSGVRKNFSNEDLNQVLKDANNKKVLKKLSNGSNCIMYRSIEELEKLTRRNNKIVIYSAPVKLKNTFDNKILFREKIQGMGLNAIPGKIVFLKDLRYEQVKPVWGEKFVLKYPVSSSGNRIHLVEHCKTYNDLKTIYPDEPVIIEKYLDGYSLNINAVVGGQDSLISALSLQIIGRSSLVNGRFGFCGNDFASAKLVENKVRNKVFSATEKIAQWMVKWGYRGIMGIDFVISDGVVYPVEINPRFQNSTSLLTLLEIEKNMVPLVFFHLREYDHALGPKLSCPGRSPVDFNASQLILHNLEGKRIKINKAILPGIYCYKNNRLQYRRNGFSVLDCTNEDEFAVCGGVLGKGAIMEPGAPLVKLHFRKGVLKNNLEALQPEIELTVKKIYNEFIGESSDGTEA